MKEEEPRPAYLTFVGFDDYVSHLNQQRTGNQPVETRLEIGYRTGKPGEFRITPITYSAVATARCADHIAMWVLPLVSTDSFQMDLERRERKENGALQKTHEQMDKLRERFAEREVMVKPGRWRYEAPESLSE